MNIDIKDQAPADQAILAQHAVQNSSGTQQNQFLTTPTADPAVIAAVTPPPAPQAGFEMKEIDIPAVPSIEPQQGPKPGSPRWNEIYHKAKKADKLEGEVNQLKQTVEMLAKNMGSVSISNITAEISNLQAKHKEALEQADYARASQLNSNMMELMVKKQQAEVMFGPAVYGQAPPVQQAAPIAEAINQQSMAPQPPIEAIVAAQTFEQNNPWYVTDPALNAAFNAVHQQTMSDYNWADRPIAAQLNESLRRFKGTFPEKFRQPTPPSAVASVTPSAPAQQAPQAFLSPEEKQMAIMFAPPGTNPQIAESEFLKNKMYYVSQGVKF